MAMNLQPGPRFVPMSVGMSNGMPADFAAALAQKYAILQQQANAQSREATARAGLMAQQAQVVKPTADAAVGLDKANAAYRNKETGRYDDVTDSEIAAKEAYRAYMEKQTNNYDRRTNSEIGLQDAQADNYRATGRNTDAQTTGLQRGMGQSTVLPPPVTPRATLTGSQGTGLLDSAKQTAASSTAFSPLSFGMGGGGLDLAPAGGGVASAPTPAPSFSFNRGSSTLPSLSLPDFTAPRRIFSDEPVGRFKRGTARVPGKGTGDKVPALLEPGEAILNKHAAGMIGRDKIAKANAKGNQMRSKENLSKLAQALQMMGMA